MKKKLLIFAAIFAVLVSIACLSVSAAEVASGTCVQMATISHGRLTKRAH